MENTDKIRVINRIYLYTQIYLSKHLSYVSRTTEKALSLKTSKTNVLYGCWYPAQPSSRGLYSRYLEWIDTGIDVYNERNGGLAMGKNFYYFINLIKYWKKFFHMIRHSSEWHLSEITPDELLDHINSNLPPAIFDIRSVQEFNGADGHIPNAMSIPIRELSSNLKDLQSYIYDYKDKEIVTMCPGGGLSLIAVDVLVEAGFENVKSLHGGLDMWREKGYPINTAEDNISPHEDAKPGTFEGKQSLDEKSLSEVHYTLDARGLVCPQPILKSKKKLKTLKLGQVLEILTTDPGSKRDIPAWAHVTGQELLVSEERGPKDFRFLVKRMK